MKVIVRIPPSDDRRWKSWAKLLEGVDRSVSTGYCFKGPFLPRDSYQELKVGSYVLTYDEVGSHKYHNPVVRLYVVDSSLEGNLRLVEEWKELHSKGWALLVRDKIAERMGEDKEEDKETDGDLGFYSTEDLIREAVKRIGVHGVHQLLKEFSDEG